MARARVQQSRLERLHVPAPIGGINTVSPGVSLPEGDSILSYNLIGAEYGLRSRLGWREYVTGLDGPVRSLMPFRGSSDGATRLFAATETGVWDCSASTTAPVRLVTFSEGGPNAGFGSSTVFVNAAGLHFLVYTDEQNGLFVYSEADSTWTQGGLTGAPVTGVDPKLLASVIPWKARLWFVQRDSTKAWYLDVGAVTGPATGFNFGSQFRRGGDLRTLASWTHEGGISPDDYLVAVSGGGDVVVYKGTDPSQPSTFGIVGAWWTGTVPAGRRITTDVGGELLVMSSTGVQSMNKLTSGGAVYSTQYETAKIANLWNQLQSATAGLRGWAMRIHPADASLLATVPVAVNQDAQVLAMSLTTRGWHQYRDLPVGLCAEPWNGTLYFGTNDGKICVNDGYVDGVLLGNPNAYAPIEWSLLTGFSNGGDPRVKRVQNIRATLMSQAGNIPFEAQARYAWDMNEIANAPAGTPTGSAWDLASWDADDAIWGGAYQPQAGIFGATGIGAEVAIAMRGQATSRMTLTGINVEFDVAGRMF